MAWQEECKVVFRLNAKELLFRDPHHKGITKILRKFSKESGIPFKTLERWYYEKDSLKNEGNTPKKSNPEQTQADNSNLKKLEYSHGGARPGAGRPEKRTIITKSDIHYCTEALEFVEMAKITMQRIRENDPERNIALSTMALWCFQLISDNILKTQTISNLNNFISEQEPSTHDLESQTKVLTVVLNKLDTAERYIKIHREVLNEKL